MTKFIEMEKALTLFINRDLRNPFLDFVLPIFSETWILYVVLVIFLLCYAYYLNSKKEIINLGGEKAKYYFIFFLLFLLISVVVNNLLSDLIKVIADKPRPAQALPDVFFQSRGIWLLTESDMIPRQGGSSFISSHASNSMAVATVFFLYFRRVNISIFIIPIIVSWSRIYLGKHYFIDVFCGLIFGFCVTYCMFILLKKYFKIFDNLP